MPVQYIKLKKGYRYGDTGKLYTTKEFGVQGARIKAAKQGQAIEISKLRESHDPRAPPEKKSSTTVHASSKSRAHTREI